jgi:serine protease Do
VRLNDKAVATDHELSRLVAGTRSGDVIKVEVLRDGRMQTFNVRSGARPTNEELAKRDDTPDAPSVSPTRPALAPPNALGMRLGSLDEPNRKSYAIAPAVKGAVIESVRQTSDAAKKGIKRGDVIVSVNGTPVSAPEDVSAAIDAAKKASRSSVFLLVNRKPNQFGVAVKFGD